MALGLAVGLLAGCSLVPRAPVAPAPTTHPAEVVMAWMAVQREVAQLSVDDAVQELVAIGLPQDDDRLFRYALLNQQLQTLGGWTQARDAFAALSERSSLLLQQQQLAGSLRDYNQARINGYMKVAELREQQSLLQQELQTVEEERQLLQQKIQALTDLEADISTRREE